MPDIGPEIISELHQGQERKVRFSETLEFIRPEIRAKVDEYDILRDIQAQLANVTIGQLLHDNPNYQKQVKSGLIRARKRMV